MYSTNLGTKNYLVNAQNIAQFPFHLLQVNPQRKNFQGQKVFINIVSLVPDKLICEVIGHNY